MVWPIHIFRAYFETLCKGQDGGGGGGGGELVGRSGGSGGSGVGVPVSNAARR